MYKQFQNKLRNMPLKCNLNLMQIKASMIQTHTATVQVIRMSKDDR